jgi:hypothetical protein
MGVGAGAPGPVTLALVQHSPVPLTLVREPAQGAAGDAG